MAMPLAAMTRRSARASRVGLVIIGLILLLGGGTVLARGLNASSSVLGSPHSTLLTQSQVSYPARNGWVWPVAAGVSALIALLALYWMTAQTRTRTVRRLSVEPERRHGRTLLRTDAVTDAITGELESYPGVRAAGATLRGSALNPFLRLAVTVENRAQPDRLRTRIETEAIGELRTFLERDSLPAVVILRFSRAFDRHLA